MDNSSIGSYRYRIAQLCDLDAVLSVLVACPLGPHGVIWMPGGRRSVMRVLSRGPCPEAKRYGDAAELQVWLREHAIPGGRVYLGELVLSPQEAAPVCVAAVFSKHGRCHLRQLVVLPQHRRKGVASALLDAVLQHRPDLMQLSVAQSLDGAVSWAKHVSSELIGDLAPLIGFAGNGDVELHTFSIRDFRRPALHAVLPKPDWVNAFPQSARRSAGRVADMLRPPSAGGFATSHASVQAYAGHVRLGLNDAEYLHLPVRIAGPVKAMEDAVLEHPRGSPERAIALALGTRHSSGYFRESCMRRSMPLAYPWQVGYAMLLLGEQVVEVAEVAARALEGAPDEWVRGFIAHNGEVFRRVERRAVSYWNEYWRGDGMALWEYPPYMAVQRLKRR